MAAEVSATPSEMLQRVNDLLYTQVESRIFVTCCVCVLDPSSGLLTYANAGHMPPLQQTTQGVVELRATGMPLGLMPGMHYEEKHAHLHAGDTLILYSDGVVEVHNPQREMFGFHRLQRAMVPYRNCRETVAHLIATVTTFTGNEGYQEDDMTVVALQSSQR
jgi:serine phosphatase RsbU (regulator of sigma subunit)